MIRLMKKGPSPTIWEFLPYGNNHITRTRRREQVMIVYNADRDRYDRDRSYFNVQGYRLCPKATHNAVHAIVSCHVM
jgi:hypothetical protein